MRHYPDLGSTTDWLEHGTTNQKQGPDLGSDTSSEWNFFANSLYFISRGKQWWHIKCRLFSQARIYFVRASHVTTVQTSSHIFRWRNVNCSSDLRACGARVIYSRLVTDTTNYRKWVSNFPSTWLAFLTDQSRRVLKSWNMMWGPRTRISALFCRQT